MNVIRDLLDSKKFVGALITMISAIGFRLGVPDAQLEEIIAMVSPMLVYIGAQGFADHGRAKVDIREER